MVVSELGRGSPLRDDSQYKTGPQNISSSKASTKPSWSASGLFGSYCFPADGNPTHATACATGCNNSASICSAVSDNHPSDCHWKQPHLSSFPGTVRQSSPAGPVRHCFRLAEASLPHRKTLTENALSYTVLVFFCNHSLGTGGSGNKELIVDAFNDANRIHFTKRFDKVWEIGLGSMLSPGVTF